MQSLMRRALSICAPLVAAAAAPAGALGGASGPANPDAELQALVESDWRRQEERRGRSPEDPGAIRAALERGRWLLERLSRLPGAPDLRETGAALERLRAEAAEIEAAGAERRLSLYREIRWSLRDAALRNPLLGSHPVLFLKRRRFICQMLHEYVGYFYDYGDIDGGGVFVLERPGRSLALRDLTGRRLRRGNFATLALSFDARTVYFAFAPRAPGRPDYYSRERRSFHLYAVAADGGDLRQLTRGPHDDFDPCPLPGGKIAFLSTRRGGFGRCHNPWEPLPTYTLHRMDADGSNAETISFHETNEWHPSLLADGRIVYSRWDYVDRSAAHFHGLWVTRPDGTGTEALFGNYTQRINACFQPRMVPGSRRIAFIAGAHHANVGGALVLLDPARATLDPQSGEDRLDAVEVLTPEVCFPEAPGWPGSYFHSPWPLAEDFYLVAFSFDPLPGMGPGEKRDTETGIYLFDRSGHLELLYREPGISSMNPLLFAPRPMPPALGSEREAELGDEGEFLLVDVHRSQWPLPPDRPVRELRIFQILPKSETHVANQPRLGYANAEPARLFLGTVPVEPDGSAYFRAPARRPLCFQAVDAGGRAVQGMRSIAYLQPGERRGCVGCHAEPGAAPPTREPLAARRPPSAIQPGPDGTLPWSYPRLVQPILDARCVCCHDGASGEGGGRLDLSGRPVGPFTASYESLRPYVRWYEWGEGIGGFVTRPGRMPADESPLVEVLADATHRAAVELAESEWRRIYLWLDGNAAFYGTYSPAEQLAQRRGEAVPPPSLQ